MFFYYDSCSHSVNKQGTFSPYMVADKVNICRYLYLLRLCQVQESVWQIRPGILKPNKVSIIWSISGRLFYTRADRIPTKWPPVWGGTRMALRGKQYNSDGSYPPFDLCVCKYVLEDINRLVLVVYGPIKHTKQEPDVEKSDFSLHTIFILCS